MIFFLTFLVSGREKEGIRENEIRSQCVVDEKVLLRFPVELLGLKSYKMEEGGLSMEGQKNMCLSQILKNGR
jgi:hypothetical protein